MEIVRQGSADLATYCHYDPKTLAKSLGATTATVVVELRGAGTSSYAPLLVSYGGTAGWLDAIAKKAGRVDPWRRWCLTCWSAGGEVAKRVAALGDGPRPDAMVLLDAVYGSKPPGSRSGDGRVVIDPGLRALAAYALAAARGETTMVLVHSRIATPYASSKECVEALLELVEAELGERLGPDVSLTPADLDGRPFAEALAHGNLHVLEYVGAGKAEHIAEAALFDDVWRRWVPWLEQVDGAAVEPAPPPPTRPTGRGPRVLSVKLRGQRLPEVARWQAFLIGQGHRLKADGDFGPKTDAATKSFQAKHGLVPDGEVGPRTYAKAEELAFDVPPAPETPVVAGVFVAGGFPSLPDFPPLVGTAARQRLFGAFEYEPSPTAGNPEGIRILGAWESENIRAVPLPLAGVSGAPSSLAVMFHKAAIPQLLGLWGAWERHGLLPLVQSWHGAFVARFVRGSRSTLSNHAFGTAFDINAGSNPFGAKPALLGAPGSVQELVPLAHAWGFYWGGHFGGVPDGMHFELAVPGRKP